MHSHPASKGQPSASPNGVFPANASHSSARLHSDAQHVNTSQSNTAQTKTVPTSVSDIPHPHQPSSSPETVGPVDQQISPHWVEQLQLALAIANPELLQQLVLQCQSPLVASHELGTITAAVSVPVDGAHAADSVLSVEVIACQLSQDANGHASTKHASTQPDNTVKSHARLLDTTLHYSAPLDTEDLAHQKALVNQICRETKLQTLGMNIPLPEAIALLQYGTFSLPDIQRILNLPYNGWHRSWWAMIDPTVVQTLSSSASHTVGFTIPFKRLIRSRRYADGTVMLQYKDQFAHIPPPCFRTQHQSILVHIQRPNQSISEILAWMNHAKTTLNASHGLLLYHQLSPIEQQALRNQGIYLYQCASSDPVATSGPRTHDTHQHQGAHALAAQGLMSAAHDAIPPRGIMSGKISSGELSSGELNSGERSHESVSAHALADCSICCQHQCPMQGREDSPVTACRLFQADVTIP